MSEFKLCPLIIGKEEHKSIAYGQGDYTVPIMYPCIKEKCMAYDNDGMCCYWLRETMEKAENLYAPEEVGKILITEGQENGRKYGLKLGDTIRFTPTEVVGILKADGSVKE